MDKLDRLEGAKKLDFSNEDTLRRESIKIPEKTKASGDETIRMLAASHEDSAYIRHMPTSAYAYFFSLSPEEQAMLKNRRIYDQEGIHIYTDAGEKIATFARSPLSISSEQLATIPGNSSAWDKLYDQTYVGDDTEDDADDTKATPASDGIELYIEKNKDKTSLFFNKKVLSKKKWKEIKNWKERKKHIIDMIRGLFDSPLVADVYQDGATYFNGNTFPFYVQKHPVGLATHEQVQELIKATPSGSQYKEHRFPQYKWSQAVREMYTLLGGTIDISDLEKKESDDKDADSSESDIQDDRIHVILNEHLGLTIDRSSKTGYIGPLINYTLYPAFHLAEVNSVRPADESTQEEVSKH